MGEESAYSELKKLWSSVSIKALNYSSRLILANNLDYKQVLLSQNNCARDYKGLAELIGFPYNAIKIFEESENRTMKILESWETRSDSTLDKLIDYLGYMDRYDIIEDLIPSLKKDVEAYLKHQKMLADPIEVPEVTSGPLVSYSKRGLITFDDLKNKECTIYDAYVSYAEKDTDMAVAFSQYLESPKVGCKLFIRGRDMLAGSPELDTDIGLIKRRCRHMLILLTPNFINSSAYEFQVSFADSLTIEQKQKFLIPVVVEPCDIPPIINTVSKIDLTRGSTQEWEEKKLIASLLREEKVPLFLESLGISGMKLWINPPMQSVFASPSQQSCLHAENKPEITLPPSEKHVIQPINNLSKIPSIEPADRSDSDYKISRSRSFYQDLDDIGPSKKAKFNQFLSLIYRKRTASSTSSSTSPFLASTSSEYQSQSCSNLESLENM